MSLSHKTIICLLSVLIAVNSVSVCPSGSISYDSFNLLAEDVTARRSAESDVFYRLTYEEGNYKLNSYRIVDQASNSNPALQITTISTAAESSWYIQTVSERGSCVGVEQGNNLVTYYTFLGTFTKVQTIDISSFGENVKYFVNDDCTLIRVVITNALGAISTKVFKDQVEVAALVLPQGTLFSYDFAYAIDTASNFYSLSSATYARNTLSRLKTTPVYIKWSSLIRAVITITKDTNGYSVYAIDPTNFNNFFQRDFTLANYTGDLDYLVRTSFGSILLKDTTKFVSFIQLSLTNNLITSDTYALQNTTYTSLFGSGSLVSVSKDIIFVYSNRSITYFQAFSNGIFYLGQLSTDIQARSETYRTQFSTKEVNVVLSLAAPSTLTQCTPNATPTNSSTPTNTTNSTTTTTPSTTLNPNEVKAPTLVNATTGEVLKCPDNCVTCTSTETCTVCQVGYSLNTATGKCVFCRGCLSCNPTNPSICFLCFAPSILNQTSNTCVIPTCTTENCLLCNLQGSCTKCRYGFGLNGTACQKCAITGCQSCSTSVDTCDSKSCQIGYAYYFDTTTSKGICQPCVTGCNICLETDMSACTLCSSGYYPRADADGINRCITCFDKCSTCTAANVCTKCVAGYAPNADGSNCTLRCSDNCLTCS